jgi:hypothetical protein
MPAIVPMINRALPRYLPAPLFEAAEKEKLVQSRRTGGLSFRGRPSFQRTHHKRTVVFNRISRYYFFEISPLKWLSTSARLSGFPALVNTTE